MYKNYRKRDKSDNRLFPFLVISKLELNKIKG